MAIFYPIPELPAKPDRALLTIPDGTAGIAATLRVMVQWARMFATDSAIHNLASAIVAGVEQKNYYAEAAAVQDFVKRQIRYVRDTFTAETLQTPIITLERSQGDCDDQALLVAALLLALGHPVRFIAVALDTPGNYAHVLTQTKIGAGWYGVETTEDVPFGWTPPLDFPPLIRHI